jgi:hypothetical protein
VTDEQEKIRKLQHNPPSSEPTPPRIQFAVTSSCQAITPSTKGSYRSLLCWYHGRWVILDSTSPRGGGGATATLTAAVAAGEEADEDAEEGNDSADDSVEDVANTGDDSHDGGANGPEDGLNAANNGTHCEVCVCVVWIWFW